MAARRRRRGWFCGRSRSARVARAVLLPVLVPAGLVLMLFLLPVLIPVAAYQVERDRRRRAAVAAATDCVRCGTRLGPAAEALADVGWRNHVTALHEKYPHSRLRLVRHVWAVCTACGARYEFDETRRVFTLFAEPPPGYPAVA